MDNDKLIERAILALEPFANLTGHPAVNMSDPLSKWLTIGQLCEARDALEALRTPSVSPDRIERAAQSLALICDPDIPWEDYAASEQQEFRRKAVNIASIFTPVTNEAVPTGEMIEAGTLRRCSKAVIRAKLWAERCISETAYMSSYEPTTRRWDQARKRANDAEQKMLKAFDEAATLFRRLEPTPTDSQEAGNAK